MQAMMKHKCAHLVRLARLTGFMIAAAIRQIVAHSMDDLQGPHSAPCTCTCSL